MEEKQNARRDFLVGLEKLSRETGVKIGGCGCCGSPFTERLYKEEDLHPDAGYACGSGGNNIGWISPGDKAWQEPLMYRPVKGDK